MAILQFRGFRNTVAFLAFACAACVFANDPVNIPPAELKKAELTYRDTFGPSHDKATKTAKLTEKSEFAKKLYDAHQQSANDPPFQEVLRKYALQFAQPTDPLGLAVATDVYKVYLAFPSRRALALEKIAGLQERGLATEPAATRSRLVSDVVKGYRDSAAESEKQGNATAASAAIGKARIVVRKYTPADRDTLAALDADERRMQASAAEQADTERLKSFVAKNPDDAKSKVALASRYVRYGRMRDAAELLQTSGAEWAAVAAAMEAKPIDGFSLARLLLKAQAGLPAEDRKSRYSLMQFARTALEDFRAAQAEKWADAVPTYAAVMEVVVGTEPPTVAGQSVTPLVLAMTEWAEQLAGKFDYTEASNVLVRARAVAKNAKAANEAKELLVEVDSAERVVKACIALDAEIAQWKAEEAKGALDAKGNLAYGVALLRAGRSPEAVKRLGLSNTPVFVALSQVLAKGDKAAPLALADALRAAAAELQGAEKTDVLASARTAYETFLASNPKDGPEKTRIMLLAKELPVGTRTFTPRDYVEMFDDNPAFIQRMNTEGIISAGSAASVESKDVFRGRIAMKVTPSHLTVPDLGWRFAICEHPKKPNEFRYVGFAWKKSGGNEAMIQFMDQNGNGRLYAAGTLGNGSERVTIRKTMPSDWTYEIRDVFADHGTFVVQGFQVWPLIGQYMLVDAIYLSKSKATLERLAGKK